MDFIDTNIIVYANDSRDKAKQERAIEIIARAMRDGTGVVSTQVLQEYANVALGKLGQSHQVVLRQIILLERLKVVVSTPALVRRAVELSGLHQVSLWDAAIIAAAEVSGCDRLLSEDMGGGRFYGSVQAVNPFEKAEPRA